MGLTDQVSCDWRGRVRGWYWPAVDGEIVRAGNKVLVRVARKAGAFEGARVGEPFVVKDAKGCWTVDLRENS